MKQDRWNRAQEEEQACWKQNKEKINRADYTQSKQAYWDLVLDRIAPIVPLKPNKRILDVGCGPSGVYLSKRLSNENITCLDPLMSEYLEMIPGLKKASPTWITGTIEKFKSSTVFDIIFAFNSIDHAKDSSLSLQSTRKQLKDDGYFVLSLNCHTSAPMAALFRVANPILDPPHPHQHTEDEYKRILEKQGFNVRHILCLDDETHWINEQTKSPSQEPSAFSFAKSLLSPQQRFFALMKRLGYKRYGDSTDKRMYAHQLFICTKK